MMKKGDQVIVTMQIRTRGIDTNYGWKKTERSGIITHASPKKIWVKLDGSGQSKCFDADQVRPMIDSDN